MIDRNFLLEKIVSHVEKQVNNAFQYSDCEPMRLDISPDSLKNQVEELLSRGLEIDDIVNFILEEDFPPSMD